MRNQFSIAVWACVATIAVARVGSGETLIPTDRAADGEMSQAIETSFEQLELDPGGEFRRMLVPKRIDELEGKRVRMRGYMWPSFKRDGIRAFILLSHRGNRFDQYASDEVIHVNVRDGWSAEFETRPIMVEGDFAIEPERGKDRYILLYRLDNASVYTVRGAELMAPMEKWP